MLSLWYGLLILKQETKQTEKETLLSCQSLFENHSRTTFFEIDTMTNSFISLPEEILISIFRFCSVKTLFWSQSISFYNIFDH